MTTTPSPLRLSASEVDTLIGWARQAGQLALSYFKNVTPQRKPDRTFLTQADLAVEQFLLNHLQSTYPGHTIIGEEGTRQNHTSPYTWTIDPIDGTTVFVQGLPGWGISLGLLYEGVPHFGLFYMPLLDDLTYIASDGRVICNGLDASDKLRIDWEDKPFLAINSTAHHDFHLDIKRTRALGSIGANLVYTVRGTATASFISKACLWDLVPGAAMLGRMGGELRYLSGRAVDYGLLCDGRLTTEPILAGETGVVADLRGRVRRREPGR